MASTFDLMIAIIPHAYPVRSFMCPPQLNAAFWNAGAPEDIAGLNGTANGFSRKSLAGSMIGGIAVSQEVIDHCAARNISTEVEIIWSDPIDDACARVVDKDVRYRFVVDMGAL